MGKYAADARDAAADIRADGAVVTFTRPGGVVDPVTQVSVGEPLEYTTPMLAIAMSAGKARYLFGDGADITKPRLSVTIALHGLSTEPRNGDRFTWGGKAYALQGVEPLDPAGDGAIIATGYAEAA